MSKRIIQQLTTDGEFKICFNGFYDYSQFDKAIKIFTNDMGAICTDSSMGFFDSASCVILLEGIEIHWNFDNWVGIEMKSTISDDESVKTTLRLWADKIFRKLIEEFGEYDEAQ